jgi:fructokinase
MKAVCFGEILYDRFPDGDKLGGAAMNCAWHIRQLGATVAMVSAVGDDELGSASLDTLKHAGIDFTHVGVRPESTGIVDIVLNNGQPNYTIRENVAWDYITRPNEPVTGDLLYFGTLAQRSRMNRATLNALLENPFAHRFFDVNLRQTYYSQSTIHDGFAHATVVKMNEEEWTEVRAMLGNDDQHTLIQRFDLHALIITLGDRGAELFTPDEHVTAQSTPVELVDAVGAGDAFSAVFCVALMKAMSFAGSLQRACDVGAYVVQHRGAQVELPEIFACGG